MFGAIDFYQHARAAGIKPILGCELYIAPGSRFERAPVDGQYEGANHVTALVRNETGYRNLIKLVSKGYLEGFYYKPRVDKELLAQHADGLLILSGCLNSEVSRLLLAGEERKALEVAGWYADVFGRDHYFMEIQAHGLADQIRVTEGTLRIARALGVGVARHERLALPRGDGRARPRGPPLPPDRRQDRRPQPVEVRHRGVLPQVGRGDAQGLRASARGLHEHPGRRRALQPRADVRPVPPAAVRGAGRPDAGLLPPRRWPRSASGGTTRSRRPRSRARFDYELGVIQAMQFSGYFLVVWDFIRYAKERGIAVGPGPRLGGRARWSPTASGSRPSIQCVTGSSSSDS